MFEPIIGFVSQLAEEDVPFFISDGMILGNSVLVEVLVEGSAMLPP